jgi:hypothetical protein
VGLGHLANDSVCAEQAKPVADAGGEAADVV